MLDVGTRYKSSVNGFVGRFNDHFPDQTRALEPDFAALASIIAFQYPVFDISPDRRLRKSYCNSGDVECECIDYAISLCARSSRKVYAFSIEAVLSAFLRELVDGLMPYKRVLVLLSGGLDSRLILVALRHLVASGELACDLRLATWGAEGCADVHIAQCIAKKLSMPIEVLKLSADTMMSNIEDAAKYLGPIISPVHLHCMSALVEGVATDCDCLVAGSLGNALLGGEYLWRHVSYCRQVVPNDWLGIMKPAVRSRAFSELREILRSNRELIRKTASSIEAYEAEMMISYCQNLLLSAFELVRVRGISVFQASSLGTVWSVTQGLPPGARSEKLREALIEYLDPDIAQMSSTSVPRMNDGFSGILPLHEYGRWSAERCDEILSYILTSKVRELECFELAAIEKVARVGLENERVSNEVSYVLQYLACLGVWLEERGVVGIEEIERPFLAAESEGGFGVPPWGFASRPHDTGFKDLWYRAVQPLRTMGRGAKIW